ncbi:MULTISPECIES: hypothetical protein [unclassified Streptomyces]|uniref:hypothetical protein n=1 Tax=unclassified Streptomyces TaxID=2593676 RepID=UPI00088EEBDE|nr:MULTISPECIES: hypothetical protein [unclassified Streptomyces]PBC81343.1 hypothetical protein BX261_1208 [Streptomyces sp. 2321.6]SDR55499.1 hypothetical protein SAMN05216511_6008 [Streptomyces sp. KS_16]SEC11158.1 hypothetical protein SAMN05428940_1207 [Streptomyces sp. 2133.1]SNC64934.1 hypothetical protein SAMN06272741_1207 [Streptomyces sp. 2114.4]
MLTSTVCAAVSAVGLGIAALTAYRKRFLAATRIAAFSLVPIGLVMTGVIDWVTNIVFKPTVWAGFGVLALSAVLFMISRGVERRRGGIGSRKERKAAAADRSDAVAPAASVPSLGAARGAAQPASKGKAAQGKDGAPRDDFSDIEAILKKHGI